MTVEEDVKNDNGSKERMARYKEDKIRWRIWSTQEEYDEIARKAQECKLSFSEYIRRCALQRKTVARTDSAMINALVKLGGLQNKIMMDINETLENKKIDDVAALLPEARKIYREIHNAVRRIKKTSEE
jgi:hypothetical protein